MSKKNLILGGILVALIFLVYLYQGPWKNDLGPNFLANLEADQINKVELIRDQATTTLIKEEDSRWQIAGPGDFYVVSSEAQELEEKLTKLFDSKFELVSADADKKPDFSTDLENGTRVKLYQENQEVADFVIGLLDSSFLASSYIASPDYPETYMAQNVDLSNIRLKSDWRNLTIFDSSPEEVTKLRFQYPDQEFTLEQVTTTRETETGEEEEVLIWQGVAPQAFSVSEEKVESILEVMTDLEAFDIPEQDFTGTRLEEHLIIVEASGAGVNNTLMVGGTAELNSEAEEELEVYYAKRADSDSIYLITQEQKDLLDQTQRSLGQAN